MPLTYDQQKELSSHLQKTGKNLLERTIVISTQFFTLIIRFIWSGIKQVIGK